ncbi:MAG: penicillin acylase family protein, partial [Flavobacteriaceae bacterium]
MKLLKRIGWTILVLLVIGALALILCIQGLKPDYEGQVAMPNLDAPVDVYYDQYGVPHIYADTEREAFKALGYVHAQDRLWQMEVLRRVASGGLSEVFGEDLINTDRFFLALDIDEASKRTLAKLDKDDKGIQLCEAYLEGVNQFVEEGPAPVEFYLTGIEKRPFTLTDVYNSLGYMAFSFAMAHKTDPLITNIGDTLGEAYIADLGLYSSGDTEQIHNHFDRPMDSVANGVTAMVHQALEGLSLPLFEGSNSWVIAPSKTKNGQVIFANDPHIGFAQPSVWYEAHVVTPSYEKYGYHLAGIPFPLLGHDRRMAYGMTMFENDDIDFYFEEFHPTDSTKYRDGDSWKSFQNITKTIKVKGAPDVEFTYKKTKHGPVLNGIADQITDERPIS